MTSHYRVERHKSKSKPRPLCGTSRKVIKEACEQAAREGKDPKLAGYAALIRERGKRVIADIIDIGRLLSEAKKLVGHGGWNDWLKSEFGWSEDTALNFIRVYELSENHKSRNFRDLRIAPSALYLLANKSTPKAIRTELLERTEAGENITVKTVKEALKPEVKKDDITVVEGLRQPGDGALTPAEKNNRRWIQTKALKVAREAIEVAEIADSEITPELKEQLSGLIEPEVLLPTLEKGSQSLAKLADFLRQVLAEQPAQAEAAE